MTCGQLALNRERQVTVQPVMTDWLILNVRARYILVRILVEFV